jgi:hypothetical protein
MDDQEESVSLPVVLAALLALTPRKCLRLKSQTTGDRSHDEPFRLLAAVSISPRFKSSSCGSSEGGLSV